ncbi:MBL fold metallo-hydrolase, partial [Nocardiopsis tropica]|nr:MBL fold metallo-hydrolase [Nocardiopsis tropica]
MLAARPTGPLAANCYVLAPAPGGDCIVVDPGQEAAEQVEKVLSEHGLTPVAVLLTHGHFDHVWSAAELGGRHGVPVHVHARDRHLLTDPAAGVDPGFAARLSSLLGEGPHAEPSDLVEVAGGDTLSLAGLEVGVEHTPGHTPEHLSFLITDGAFSDQPGYLLSGDFVFAGDIGRPDLLDEAAGGEDTRVEGARHLFASLRDTFLTLPDHVQVLPGHGAGSACGKALGALPATTVGY